MERSQKALAQVFLVVLTLMQSACGVLIAQSRLEPDQDLLPGESLVLSKPANLFVKPSEYGLASLFSGLKGVIDIEAIGGQVHLTNYRLIFKSHEINRLKGKVSVFLPTIKSLQDVSGLMVKKVSVATELTEYEFVVWGIPAFIEAVRGARAALSPEDISRLGPLTAQYPSKVGEGLMGVPGSEGLGIFSMQPFGVRAHQPTVGDALLRLLIRRARNPFEALGLVALFELSQYLQGHPR
jgi:hypothetical protein